MCTNLSSQTLSYTMMLIVTYTQPYKGYFWVANFINFISPRQSHCPQYTLFITQNLGVLHSSQEGVDKVYKGNMTMVNHSFFFYFEDFCCVMHSFF